MTNAVGAKLEAQADGRQRLVRQRLVRDFSHNPFLDLLNGENGGKVKIGDTLRIRLPNDFTVRGSANG